MNGRSVTCLVLCFIVFILVQSSHYVSAEDDLSLRLWGQLATLTILIPPWAIPQGPIHHGHCR